MRYELEFINPYTRYIIQPFATIEDAVSYIAQCYDARVTFQPDSDGVMGVEFDEDVILILHDRGERHGLG